MLTSIDVKFIFDSTCLSASLGDEGLFSSASILLIADVVHWVVFLLFLLYLTFSPIVRLFLTCERSIINVLPFCILVNINLFTVQ